MRARWVALTLLIAPAIGLGLLPDSLSAQGPPPSQASLTSGLVLGLTAGAGAVDNKRLFDAWTFGPVFGGRVGWARRTWSANVRVDVQPFRADRTDRPGDFKAIYFLPTFSSGSPGRQLSLSLGLGVFDLTEEDGEDVRESGFVAALSGSTRISRSLSVELGWKRIRNVAGLKASVYTLQLVQLWGF